MKAKSSMVRALQKAQGWEAETWECKLSILLERLDIYREEVREFTLKNNTPEEDAEWLKLARGEVKKTAGAVGVLIAQELLKGNDDVLLSVSNGFKNLKKGKPWDPSKKRSDKAERVLCGLFRYEFQNDRKPTRKELAEFVGLSRADVSDAVTLMRIEDRLSDGRQERHKKARPKP
jgi:hypothetical protein